MALCSGMKADSVKLLLGGLGLITLWPGVVLAQTVASPVGSEVWQQEAASSALHERPRWHQLVHYSPRLTGAVRSDIHSPEFFLHPDGAGNPQAELQATIEAMFEPVNGLDESHAQCRFPARLLWLQQELPAAADLPSPECIGYGNWRGEGGSEITSISLISADGYLRNPSSLYGHVLLKLNERGYSPDPGGNRQNLLATSVNFGVDLPSGESPLMFIGRGMLGGYQAVFSHARFHQNSVLYGEYQQRDLWEYRLDLEPEQTALIVAHTWELLGKEFTYYFTGSNCAYRTAAVINLVLPEGQSLDNRIKPWTMPHDIFNHLAGTQLNGRDLVESVIYYPSRESELAADWADLNPAQRALAQRWLAEPDLTLISEAAMSDAEQAALLDVLLAYSSIQTEYPLAWNGAPGLTELMARRAALPSRTVPEQPLSVQPNGAARAVPGAPAPVHRANYPTLLETSGLWNQEQGPGAMARFRLSYYDLLARPVGRPEFSELSMLDVKVTAFEDKVQLRSLDLVSVTALNVPATGLPGARAWSGRLRAGYEQTGLACTDCGAWFAEGGPGMALGRSGSWAAYGLLEGRLDTETDGVFSLTPRTGLINHWGIGFSSGLSAAYRWPVAQTADSGDWLLDAGMRVGSSQRWDVRLRWQHWDTQEARLSLGTYW